MKFKDPIAPPKSVGKVDPKSGVKSPKFDKRTGPTVSCGDDYKVGFRTPVGKFSASPMSSGPIPQTSKAFKAGDVLDEPKKA